MDGTIYDFGVVLVVIAMVFSVAACGATAFWLKVWPPTDRSVRHRWSRLVDLLFRLFLVLAAMFLLLIVAGWILDLIFQGYIGPPGREE